MWYIYTTLEYSSHNYDMLILVINYIISNNMAYCTFLQLRTQSSPGERSGKFNRNGKFGQNGKFSQNGKFGQNGIYVWSER